MDPYNPNELAATVISQAHTIRLLEEQAAALRRANDALTTELEQLRPAQDDAEQPVTPRKQRER